MRNQEYSLNIRFDGTVEPSTRSSAFQATYHIKVSAGQGLCYALPLPLPFIPLPVTLKGDPYPCLSLEEGVNLDNHNQILLKPEYFANFLEVCAIDATHASPVNNDLLLQKVKAALLDDEVTKLYKNLLKTSSREFRKELQDWNFENGLLLRHRKVYIPNSKDEDLCQRVMEIHHDHPSAGHPGQWKTYKLISRNYWWLRITYNVKNYVSSCETCQQTKNRPQQPYGPLLPNKVPGGP